MMLLENKLCWGQLKENWMIKHIFHLFLFLTCLHSLYRMLAKKFNMKRNGTDYYFHLSRDARKVSKNALPFQLYIIINRPNLSLSRIVATSEKKIIFEFQIHHSLMSHFYLSCSSMRLACTLWDPCESLSIELMTTFFFKKFQNFSRRKKENKAKFILFSIIRKSSWLPNPFFIQRVSSSMSLILSRSLLRDNKQSSLERLLVTQCIFISHIVSFRKLTE